MRKAFDIFTTSNIVAKTSEIVITMSAVADALEEAYNQGVDESGEVITERMIEFIKNDSRMSIEERKRVLFLLFSIEE
jgi:hypothetical protein